MKRRSDKVVSLYEFIRTGRFYVVELGFTKERILTEFCKPDDKYDLDNGMSIWSYSTFEFHFLEETLIAFWCDNLVYLRHPHKKQFRFDKWSFSNPEILTFPYFCSLLDKERIEYTVKGTFYDSAEQLLPNNLILFINGTDVHVYFEDMNDNATSIHEYSLIGIGASGSRLTHNTKDIEL